VVAFPLCQLRPSCNNCCLLSPDCVRRQLACRHTFHLCVLPSG
jgi:hypothetical protein